MIRGTKQTQPNSDNERFSVLFQLLLGTILSGILWLGVGLLQSKYGITLAQNRQGSGQLCRNVGVGRASSDMFDSLARLNAIPQGRSLVTFWKLPQSSFRGLFLVFIAFYRSQPNIVSPPATLIPSSESGAPVAGSMSFDGEVRQVWRAHWAVVRARGQGIARAMTVPESGARGAGSLRHGIHGRPAVRLVVCITSIAG